MNGVRPRRTIAHRAIFFAFYIIFLILVVEGAMSIVSRFYYPRLTVSDRDIGWRYLHTPNRVFRHISRNTVYDLYINKEGFRDDEFSGNADLRIMVLGDSMTFGAEAGQDEIFCSLLEKSLKKRLAPGTVDVMNFGMPAFSTGQELLCLKKYYDRYRPGLVILMLFAGNDFLDNTATMLGGRFVPHFVLADGDISFRGTPSPMSRSLTFLRDHSFISYCVLSLAERWNLYRTHEKGEDETALMLKILAMTRAYTESKRAPLLIFYIGGQDPHMAEQKAAVEKFCKDSGIFCKAIPCLPSERQGGYGHFNEKGHRRTADIIYASLKESRLLPH